MLRIDCAGAYLNFFSSLSLSLCTKLTALRLPEIVLVSILAPTYMFPFLTLTQRQ